LSDRERIEREAEDVERRYEEDRLMLQKRQEDYKVIEEVFDHLTLQALDKLIRKKVIDRFYGVVKAGKEARIYWAQDPEEAELAIKIYYTSTAEFRKGMMQYIQGDPRFKRFRRNPRSIIYTWTQKEFKNLQLVEGAGINAPRPIDVERNVLVMTFIGEDGIPAPLLKESNDYNPLDFYNRLLEDMKLLYLKAGLVHGDLSEYNIMVWDEKPVIFDVSQAMLTGHPIADMLVQRDITNINAYFRRLGVEIYELEEVESWVKGESESLS